VKETQLQIKLPGVPKEAKQGREVAPEWAWTEASVWTERMLATLERGIKGGKWYSLMDKVYRRENLQSAVAKVSRNKGAAGIDGQGAKEYEQGCPERLVKVQEWLKAGQYTPQPVKRVWIK
jgi:RNA-directed DNA polymerase